MVSAVCLHPVAMHVMDVMRRKGTDAYRSMRGYVMMVCV